METGTFTHDGIVFHYDKVGNGNKYVVLQHGFSDSAACWGEMPHDLEKAGYHVAMMDARGHGRSGKPDQGYTLEKMTADLAAFIEHIEFDRPVVVGHSMGGSMGGRMVSAYKESLRAAVLIDPAFRDVKKEEKEEAKNLRAENIRMLKRMSIKELREETRRKHPAWGDIYIESGVWGKVLMAMGVMEIYMTIDQGWREDLEKSERPILLVTAEEKLGAIVSRKTAEWITSEFKKVEELYVPGVGHSIHREKYDEVMAGLLDFFRRQFA